MYVRNKALLNELLRKARRNRYQLELLRAVNDFQVTSPQLLLSLKESDTAQKKNKASGVKHVREALEEFDEAWKRLKEVYERTPFLSYPENYVKDRYFHLWSRGEDLSCMIQVEKEYPILVRKWLEKNPK